MVYVHILYNTLYNGWKNNIKAYRMINFNICFILYVFKLVNGWCYVKDQQLIWTTYYKSRFDINIIKKITSKLKKLKKSLSTL